MDEETNESCGWSLVTEMIQQERARNPDLYGDRRSRGLPILKGTRRDLMQRASQNPIKDWEDIQSIDANVELEKQLAEDFDDVFVPGV